MTKQERNQGGKAKGGPSSGWLTKLTELQARRAPYVSRRVVRDTWVALREHSREDR
ncbi:MAG: hypothetical protein RJA70_4295, partial [Pseudomonadota bacterium]